MGEKILLIDGHSMLNRAFYGVPMLTNSEGRHTNAVYGFLNIMLKVIEEEQPQYLTVAFDVHAPTFRHKMYAAYKGTRKPMPEELREQVPLMKEVLGAMGIRIVEKAGYEADDILGTLSRKGEEEGMEVTILSGDRDLLQLVTDKVHVRLPRTVKGSTTVETYDAQKVREQYEITPAQVVDLKALMGDASDNIPGIPGVGVKTATKLIASYGTIENAHDHLQEIKPKKARESLRDHYDLAVLSRKLAKIDRDAPVDLDLETSRMKNLFTPEAYEIFRKLDFRNLLTHFASDSSRKPELPEVDILKDLGAFDEVSRKARKAEKVGLSALTDGKTILGVGIALSETEVYEIPLDGFASNMYLKMLLRSVFTEAGEIAVYGLKDMLRVLQLEEQGNIFDIRIAAYLLDPLKSDYPYDSIAADYGGISVPSGEELFGTRKLPAPADMDPDKAASYIGWMAYVALAVMDVMKQKLDETGMLRLFREVEMPLVFTLSDMEKAGMKVHGEELIAYGKDLSSQIEKVEKKIYEAAGETFNINSPKQLGEILFEKMKLPGGKKTKTGYSTAASVLEKLAPDVPMVADVLEYRQLTKLKSTYADSLAGFIAEDGRIHSTFHQTITATGRISSTDPNLQNIPVRMELGRQIRKVFVPEDGCVYIDADYSQIELRVLAHFSGDQKLIEAYREARDIHAITASQVFHVPFDEVTPLQRRNAKAVNFGIVYGISSFGLSQGLSISRKEASEYIEQYFRTYPGIRKFLDGAVESAKKNGYSVTLYGRRRPIPELKSGNFMQRSFGERVAMNAPIQGTAADIIKIAMNRVHRRLEKENRKARLILQVHDELLIEAPEEEKDEVCRLLEEEMCHAADLAVDLVVDMHTGYSWYEAK